MIHLNLTGTIISIHNDIMMYTNKTNHNVTNTTLNATRTINDVALASAETLHKSIEIAQKYYNETAQNYLNFVNKIEKSYYNH